MAYAPVDMNLQLLDEDFIAPVWVADDGSENAHDVGVAHP